MLLRVVEIALLKSLCLEAPDPVTTEPFFAHRLQLEAVAASLPYESDAARAERHNLAPPRTRYRRDCLSGEAAPLGRGAAEGGRGPVPAALYPFRRCRLALPQ